MITSSLNQLSIYDQTNKKKIAFGYNAFIDIGASHPGGTIKMVLKSGKKEFTSISDVICRDGVYDIQDFLNSITKKIEKLINDSQEKIASLKKDDKKLDKAVIFVPAHIVNNKASILVNIRDANNKSLENVNFGLIEGLLKKSGIQISEKFKLSTINDIIGTASGVLPTLLRNYRDLFCKFTQVIVCNTGGGCGIAYIRKVGGGFLIKAKETNFNPPAGLTNFIDAKTNNMFAELKEGACVPALISNYGKALDMEQNQINSLVQAANAGIVTRYMPDLKQEEMQTLINEGLFDKKTMTLTDLKEHDHLRASKDAIFKYIDSIAKFYAAKSINDKNALVLSGPLVKGIKTSIQENPENFDGKTLAELIEQRTREYLNKNNQGKKMAHKIKVIDNIEISDNTLGAELLMKGYTIDAMNQSNCMILPDIKL